MNWGHRRPVYSSGRLWVLAPARTRVPHSRCRLLVTFYRVASGWRGQGKGVCETVPGARAVTESPAGEQVRDGHCILR